MRIKICQLNPIVGDVAGNKRKILSSIILAQEEKADLVVFPEMALTGYPPQDLLLRNEFIEAVEKAVEELASYTKGITVCLGIPRKSGLETGKPLYNSAAPLQEGKLLTYYDKQLLPDYDVFNERRYFEPGSHSTVLRIREKNVAFLICEDIWVEKILSAEGSYAKDPIANLEGVSIDLLVVLSASPYFVGKDLVRQQLLSKACQRLQSSALLCNQVGANDQLIFDGNSLFFNKKGELIAHLKSFQEEEERLVFLDQAPVKWVSFSSEEEYFEALSLGIRDYCHKLSFNKVLLGLSGGIDSALVAAIAVHALGQDNVLGVLMPSRYTSQSSIDDALWLAKNLRIETLTLSIESSYESFLTTLEEPFKGYSVDITEENLQARIRGTLLMALANKWQRLVLNTGNKSGLATGYCTLYGDMCGALSVIGDLTKAQVYKLASWVKTIPHTILTKEPSAELKPDQKDSDTLAPYPLLDQVVVGYLEEGLSAEQIAKKYGFDLAVVEKLVRMIHRNEYKRAQAPPILKVSKKTFSKGRHYPIVEKWY